MEFRTLQYFLAIAREERYFRCRRILKYNATNPIKTDARLRSKAGKSAIYQRERKNHFDQWWSDF